MADKPSLVEVSTIVAAMAESIPFFPKSDLVQRTIAAEIHRFVSSYEELAWFGQTAMTKLGKFESIAHLRAVFCTRYKPADGVKPTVEPPTGFRAGDLESSYFEREMEEDNRRLEAYRQQALAAPAEEHEPFQLPEAKQMPALKRVVM